MVTSVHGQQDGAKELLETFLILGVGLHSSSGMVECRSRVLAIAATPPDVKHAFGTNSQLAVFYPPPRFTFEFRCLADDCPAKFAYHKDLFFHQSKVHTTSTIRTLCMSCSGLSAN